MRKLNLIYDWPSFTSWALLPTIMFGRHSIGNGGWAYLLWGKGRIGLWWNAPDFDPPGETPPNVLVP